MNEFSVAVVSNGGDPRWETIRAYSVVDAAQEFAKLLDDREDGYAICRGQVVRIAVKFHMTRHECVVSGGSNAWYFANPVSVLD